MEPNQMPDNIPTVHYTSNMSIWDIVNFFKTETPRGSAYETIIALLQVKGKLPKHMVGAPPYWTYRGWVNITKDTNNYTRIKLAYLLLRLEFERY